MEALDLSTKASLFSVVVKIPETFFTSHFCLSLRRLRHQHERIASLVEEMDSLKRRNAFLAREIQARKEEINSNHFRSKG